MNEKTFPKWSDTVHVSGCEYVVTRVEPYVNVISLRDKYDNAAITRVEDIDEYKPRTIWIGNIEVPEPVREPLERGDTYWIVNTLYQEVSCKTWQGTPSEMKWLKMGMIHLKPRAAKQHHRALVLVSGGETE